MTAILLSFLVVLALGMVVLQAIVVTRKMKEISGDDSKPLPRRSYGQMAGSLVAVVAIVALCLVLGTAGYHYVSGVPWIDALRCASSMFLMVDGTVDHLETAWAIVFHVFYSIYSGLAFMAAFSILMGRPIHRFRHWLRLKRSGGVGEDQDKTRA